MGDSEYSYYKEYQACKYGIDRLVKLKFNETTPELFKSVEKRARSYVAQHIIDNIGNGEITLEEIDVDALRFIGEYYCELVCWESMGGGVKNLEPLKKLTDMVFRNYKDCA